MQRPRRNSPDDMQKLQCLHTFSSSRAYGLREDPTLYRTPMRLRLHRYETISGLAGRGSIDLWERLSPGADQDSTRSPSSPDISVLGLFLRGFVKQRFVDNGTGIRNRAESAHDSLIIREETTEYMSGDHRVAGGPIPSCLQKVHARECSYGNTQVSASQAKVAFTTVHFGVGGQQEMVRWCW